MSINISQEHLDYCSSITMSFVWNAFSDRQQTTILKPLREGICRRSNCTTSMIAQALAKTMEIPLIRVAKWNVKIPLNVGVEHPVWEAVKNHLQMGKVILPQYSERLEDDLQNLNAIVEKLKGGKEITLTNRKWRTGEEFPIDYYSCNLQFEHQDFSNKLFTQFKKDLVFPVKIKPEHAEFLNRLEKGEITHLELSIDSSKYNYSDHASLKEDSI